LLQQKELLGVEEYQLLQEAVSQLVNRQEPSSLQVSLNNLLPLDILWEIQYKEEILGYIGGYRDYLIILEMYGILENQKLNH
jgi:hypothetical protein